MNATAEKNGTVTKAVAKRMKAWEACRHIGQLRDELRRQLDYHRKHQSQAAIEVHPTFYEERDAELVAQIEALDMAGDALTHR